MRTMADEVTALGLDSSFYREYSHDTSPTSHITNYTTLDITADTVNLALEEFTEKTDIPVAIVVDTTENAFGKTLSLADVVTVILMIALIVVAIVLIVRAVRSNKNGPKNGSDNDRYGGNGGYHNNNYNRGYDQNQYNRSRW